MLKNWLLFFYNFLFFIDSKISQTCFYLILKNKNNLETYKKRCSIKMNNNEYTTKPIYENNFAYHLNFIHQLKIFLKK
jgi:hypothetical protein